MSAASTTIIAGLGSLNDSGVQLGWNKGLPRYVYRDIPGIFEVIGIFFNVALITYFIKSKRYRSPLFVILTSLAVMDTWVCTGGAMYAMFVLPTMTIPKSEFLCPISGFFAVGGVVGSEHHLLFFAGLRLYQAISPLKARATVTMHLMVKYCVGIELIATCTGLVYGAFTKGVPAVLDGKEVTICIFIGDNATKDLLFMILCTIIPCLAIFILHVLKYFVYKRSGKSLEVQQERKNPDAKAVTIVIVLFYVCWMPAFTYMVIQHIGIEAYDNGLDNLFLVLLHLLYVNSILNPVVYVLAMKPIRDEFLSLFGVKRIKISKVN